MTADSSLAPELETLVGQQVVVDTKSPFFYIGTLAKVNRRSLLLTEVDVHNTNESSTPDDLYVIEARKHGVRINRHSVYVLARDIVSISPLSDIVLY